VPESFDHPVIHLFDVERGAVCMDCDRPFRPGDRYATRPLGVAGDIPVTEVVCLTCGYSPVQS
jgi:RNase P subunit RPR2